MQLKEVQEKFMQNVSIISSMKSAQQAQDILVPLTSSVYISGVFTDKDTVMIDIGTGYFVEKVGALVF